MRWIEFFSIKFLESSTQLLLIFLIYSEDRFGEIERINFSQPQRDSHFNVPLDKVKPWYKAMDKFTKAIMSKDYCVTYKMKEGTCFSLFQDKTCIAVYWKI